MTQCTATQSTRQASSMYIFPSVDMQPTEKVEPIRWTLPGQQVDIIEMPLFLHGFKQPTRLKQMPRVKQPLAVKQRPTRLTRGTNLKQLVGDGETYRKGVARINTLYQYVAEGTGPKVEPNSIPNVQPVRTEKPSYEWLELPLVPQKAQRKIEPVGLHFAKGVRKTLKLVRKLCESIQRTGKKPVNIATLSNGLHHLKNTGGKKVVFLAEHDTDDLAIAMGQALLNDLDVTLVDTGKDQDLRCNPCTTWEAKDGSRKFEDLPVTRRQLADNIVSFKLRRYSLEQISKRRLGYGTIQMFSPSDYRSMWTADGTKRLHPPEGIDYPHEIDARDLSLGELPLKRVDYMLGLDYVRGELLVMLRQWAQYLRDELKASFNGQKEQSDTEWNEFMAAGYWDKNNQFIGNGTQGPLSKFGADVPIWLAVKGRNGQVLDASNIDDAPKSWKFGKSTKAGLPWAFNNLAIGKEKVSGKDLVQQPSRSEEADPDWQPREPRKVKPEELLEECINWRIGQLNKKQQAALDNVNWLLSRNHSDSAYKVHGDAGMEELEKSKDGLRKLRNQLRILSETNELPQWLVNMARKKAEENVWHEAGWALEAMERVKQEAEDSEIRTRKRTRSKEELQEDLQYRLKEITKRLQRISGMINQPRGKATRSLRDELEDAYAEAKTAVDGMCMTRKKSRLLGMAEEFMNKVLDLSIRGDMGCGLAVHELDVLMTKYTEKRPKFVAFVWREFGDQLPELKPFLKSRPKLQRLARRMKIA